MTPTTARTRPTAGTAGTVAAIKELMLARSLRPGDAMPSEVELTEALGVSRGSLREAIRTLAALDILDVRHGLGTFVGGLSMRPFVEATVFQSMLTPGADGLRLREAVEIRRGLDAGLAPEVLVGIDESHLSRLDAHVAAMEECARRGEPFTAHDRQFHLCLAELVTNTMYRQLVDAFWDIHMSIGPPAEALSRAEHLAGAQAHRDLLDSAAARDVEGYRRAVEAHYAPLLAGSGSLVEERR